MICELTSRDNNSLREVLGRPETLAAFGDPSQTSSDHSDFVHPQQSLYLVFVFSGFECRCANLFCGFHRYSDQHNCPYDYKAEAAAKIRKENPVVVADKIQRI